MNLKKIAFLIPYMQAGGMERVMSEILLFISSNYNVECHLVLYGKNEEIFYDIPKNVLLHRPSFKFNEKNRLIMSLKTMSFIRSTVKGIQPDSILSFGEIWNNLVLLSLIHTKIPVYVSDRCAPDENLGFLQNILRNILYPNSAGIIAQTERAKEFYKKKFRNINIKVIGNPIRAIHSDQLIIKEKIVVSVGRLIKRKNFDRLIDIFDKTNNKEWKLVIIGGDSNKQNNSITLKEQISKLGLTENVILTGIQKDVDSFLLRSSIFAFTSSSEGFPNVIGEAMSAGLPVVAYDCVAGPADMIEDDKSGFLIPLYDDDLFVKQLNSLMANEDKRLLMGDFAKNRIKRFSTDNIGAAYYKFIMPEKN
ncbi:MAG TPA: glycosyltransferase [Edaphocola sp.]|nr:glycosyltransferase [Edaphocola sp.]